LPDAVALGVEEFLRRPQMIGDNRIKRDLPGSGNCLLCQRDKSTRLEVPASYFRGFPGSPVFLRQGCALPEIADIAFLAGVAGLDALFFDSATEGIVAVSPDRPVRRMGFRQQVEVVPAIIPGPGAKTVLDNPLLHNPAPAVVTVAAPADAFYFAVFVLVMAAVALYQVQQGVVAVLLADLFVQSCCAGYPVDLVARVVVVAAGAAFVVFYANQPARFVPAVAA